MFFFRARAVKGIVRHIEVSNVVWNVIDNDKLASQIARLAAIVVIAIEAESYSSREINRSSRVRTIQLAKT